MLYIIAFYSAFNLSHLVKCYLCRKLLSPLSFKCGNDAKWWFFFDGYFLYYMLYSINLFPCTLELVCVAWQLKRLKIQQHYILHFLIFLQSKKELRMRNSQLSCHNYFILSSINSNLSSQRKKKSTKVLCGHSGQQYLFCIAMTFFH